jgi:two-component system LytT family response regulator
VTDAVQVIRVAIVDDEPLARERLRSLMHDREGFEIIAECNDGEQAVEVLAADVPDLVFLDVQMPELDGFGVLETLSDMLGADRLPAVIFVTAYDAYAIRAFEVNALDYLLKPFDRARFESALQRAISRLQPGGARDSGSDLRDFVAQLRTEREAANRYAERIVVRASGKIFFVRVKDIDWIEGDGNYVKLHSGGKAYLVRETLKSIEGRLDARRFLRVHRSSIVNVDRIASLEPYFHGEYVMTMRDGAKVTSSRSYGDAVRRLLQ